MRFGKASRGSPPKRRSVLTVWPWLPGVLEQWIEEARPQMPAAAGSPALWPSERGERIATSTLNRRFTECRDALGLPGGLDFHSLRRSYVTHLLEDGWDALFVQHQVGHEYASTTALYSCVSSDFRTRTLRRVLDATMTAALQPGKEQAMMTAARQVSYQWRLREVMATHGLFNATDLEPLLAERGIHLSSVQVWRLVTQTPERLSLPVLAALCDIFETDAAELIATTARNTPARKSRRRRRGSDGPERGPAPPRPAAAHPAMTTDRDPAVILITGIQAAGKSTVAQLLAEQLPRSVHVHGDLFRKMIVNGRADMTPDPSAEAIAQLRLRYRLTAATCDAYFREGFTVIAQDVILGEHLGDMVTLITARPLLVVVLTAAPEVIASRDAAREKTAYQTWTPAELAEILHGQTPRLGLWLDTTGQNPAATVETILARAWTEARIP